MSCNTVIYKGREYSRDEFLRYFNEHPGEFVPALADDITPDFLEEDPRFLKLRESKEQILKRLKRQLKDEKDRNKKETISHRIDKLTEQIDVLKDDNRKSLATILFLMEQDIATVSKILDTNNPDRKSLEYGNQLLFNYVSLLNVDFRDVVDLLSPEEQANVLKFITDATNLAERIKMLFLTIPTELVKKYTGKNLMSNGLSIDEAADSANGIDRTLQDTTENLNPIVQTLTKIIKTAQTKLKLRFIEFSGEHSKIRKSLETFQKNAGLKKEKYYDYMIQVDEDNKKTGNYVGKFSDEYNTLRTIAMSSEPLSKLEFFAQNHTFKVNKKAWEVREKNLTQWFKDNLAHTIVRGNESETEYSERLDKAAYSFAIKRNPYTAIEIIRKAKENILTVSQGELDFFSKFIKSGFYFERVDGEKMYPLEYTPNDKWIDPKYTAIQEMKDTDPRKVFYNHFVKYVSQGRDMITDEEHYLPWNYIPEKTKQMGVGSNLRQWAVDSLSQVIRTNGKTVDPITGEIEKKIPTYMLNNTLSPENKSYNLGDVLENFVKESINYDEKKAIEDDANLLLYLLREQKVYETNPDGTPKEAGGRRQHKKVSNNYQMAEYRLNAQLYDEKQDKEAITNIKTRDEIVRKQLKDIKKAIDDLKISSDEKKIALKHISENTPYDGDSTIIKDYIRLAERYKRIAGDVKYITGNKVANSLIYFTSVKLLGLNLFGGFAELLQGTSSLFIEAAGGTYFTDGEALSSLGKVVQSLTPWDNKEKLRIKRLSRLFDAQGKVFHDDAQDNIVSKVAFSQYAAANYMVNNTFLLAMLKHEKVKDKSGKEYSVEEVLDVTDNYKLSWKNSNITQELYDADGNYSEYVINLMHKFAEVLKNNRERQTFDDPILLEKSVIGRVLGQFKKNWMFRAYYYRFGGYREADLFTGNEFKGFYRSFMDLFKPPKRVNQITGEEEFDTSFSGIGSIPFNLLKTWFQFSFVGKKMGFGPKEGQFSRLDEANLRKFMRETSMAITIMLVAIMLSSMGSGDDDLDGSRRYFTNQLIRLQRDLTTYMSPSSFASIFKNPAPVISTFTDFFAISDAVVKSTVLGDPYLYEGTPREESRIYKAAKKNIPFVNQYDRLVNKFEKEITYGNY